MSSPIRILYTSCLFTFGGIEQYVLNILDHIDRKKYVIDYALPGYFTHANEKALTDRGVHVIHYGTASKKQLITEVKNILVSGNYDIVHIMQGYLAIDETAMFTIAALLNRKRCGYKIILHAHGVADNSPVPLYRRVKRNIFRFLLRRIFNLVDEKAACSSSAGHFLFGNNAKATVLPNGIHVQKFSDAEDSKFIDSWREKYSISKERFNIVTVGRISEEKNPFFTVEIIRDLAARNSDTLLTWVGDGNLRSHVEAEIEQLGLSLHFNFVGVQQHVEEILPCCDCFLFPSKCEGFGIALLEAQAAGLKAFCSDGIPSDADCGGCEFISLDQGAEEWAAAIEHFRKAPYAFIRNDDKLWSYDIRRTAQNVQNFYSNMQGAN